MNRDRKRPSPAPPRKSTARSAGPDEAAFLARYRPGDFARPSVTVDIVAFSILDGELRVLLVRRGEHPFKGAWALPGGFVRVGDGHKDQGEDLAAAAARELQEETSLHPNDVFLEQVGAFSRAGRDPRMRVITVAYTALIRPDLVPLVHAGGDAAVAEWHAVDRLGHGQLEPRLRPRGDHRTRHGPCCRAHRRPEHREKPRAEDVHHPELRQVHALPWARTSIQELPPQV
ncbi:MAG: NUDIX hydrolase [Myxococcales bacterium]|nr:NUDIX hydrolase [Myxococcales bacterium]